MTTTTQAMQQQLKTELATLTTELESLGIPDPTSPGNWIATQGPASVSQADENVIADRAEDSEERRGTLATLEIRYNNINRALKKIEDAVYGTCELCQQPIEADRLEANPASRTCKTHINNESELTE